MTAERPAFHEKKTEVIPAPEDRATDFLNRIYGEEHRDSIALLSSDEAAELSREVLVRWVDWRIFRAKQKWREATYRKQKCIGEYINNEPYTEIPDYTNPLRMDYVVSTYIDEVVRDLGDKAQPIVRDQLNGWLWFRAETVRRRTTIVPGSWLEKRQAAFEFLYGKDEGTFPEKVDHTPEVGCMSLAHLALRFNYDYHGAQPHKEMQPYEILVQRVSAILYYHEAVARKGGEAAYALVNPTRDMPLIAEVTAYIIQLWERAWYRRNKLEGVPNRDKLSPFSNLPSTMNKEQMQNPAVQYVIEAAAAVGSIMGQLYGRAGKKSLKQTIGNLASRHGPSEVARWLSGDIIRRYCIERQIDPALWLDNLTTARRVTILERVSANPLGRAQEIMERLQEELSVENIMRYTNWPMEEIVATFTRSNRMRIAERSADPVAAVKAIANKIETILSTKNLSKELNWPEERVNKTFSLNKRAAIIIMQRDALEYLRGRANQIDDLPDAQTLARAIGWSVTEVRQVFTPWVIRTIYSNWASPWDRVKEVATVYGTVLGEANLKRELRLTDAQVKSYFPKRVRQRLALYQKKPLSRAREIAQAINDISAKYPDLPLKSVATLATNCRPAVALAWAKVVDEEYHAPPNGVSARAWAASIAHHPSGTRQTHLRNVTAYRLHFEILKNPLSLDIAEEGKNLSAVLADRSSIAADPAELVLGDEGPNEALQLLADKAGLTGAELQELLAEYQTGSPDAEALSKLGPLIERLRDAATPDEA